ncbi:GNAT family N-acetyltransferase [Paenibacillus sp. T1]|uniref:GNAT family N-acetyltransferase n=2 Tax=Paenibacillus glycinis TaxID=2697035 RepID=A0ABW9XRS6_9BACL|nr:GNAT family N-acetyltransferase [Paenibacillus glycinis]
MWIRKLQVEDAESYWRLRLDALRRYPQAFGADYEDAKHTPIEEVRGRIADGTDNFILGAFADTGAIVGMVGFRREPYRKMRHKGMVWGMYVDPASQGQGAGRRLMEELMARAREMPGLEHIGLYVVDTNRSAKSLYLSLGFVTYGVERNAMKLDEGTYVHEELMVRFLERRSPNELT